MIADLTRWLKRWHSGQGRELSQEQESASPVSKQLKDLKAVQTGTIIVPKTPRVMERNVYRFGNDLEWIMMKKYDWDIICKRLIELGDTVITKIKDGEELK